MQCIVCQRELHTGFDVVELQEGVVGTRGFVPVADALLFCSESCLKGHLDDVAAPLFPRRMP